MSFARSVSWTLSAGLGMGLACSADEHPPYATDREGIPADDGGTSSGPGATGDDGGTTTIDGDEEITEAQGVAAAEAFEFDPNEIYFFGDLASPGAENDGRSVLNSLSNSKLFLMGWDGELPEHKVKLLGTNLVNSDGDMLVRFTADFYGPIPKDNLSYYPASPYANDEELASGLCPIGIVLTSPDGRLIHTCEDNDLDWFEDGEKVFHGAIAYFGYDGVVLALEDHWVTLPRFGQLGAPEVTFARKGWPNDPHKVRSRPNGVFHVVTLKDNDGPQLVSLDPQGRMAVLGDYPHVLPGYHKPIIVEGIPDDEQLRNWKLTANDDIIYVMADTTPDVNNPGKQGDYVVRCPLDDECTLVGRAQKNKVQFIITPSPVVDDPPYTPPEPEAFTVLEGTTGAESYDDFEDGFHIWGHIVNPGEGNDGRIAVAHYATPHQYVLGFDGEIEHVAHDATRYKDLASGEFRHFVPDYVGPLPTSDTGYYPDTPSEDDEIETPPNACVGDPTARVALGAGLGPRTPDYICGDDTRDAFGTDQYTTNAVETVVFNTALDFGTPPSASGAGEPTTFYSYHPEGEAVRVGTILNGLVVDVFASHTRFELLLRVQDETTFELTNEFEVWYLTVDGEEVTHTFTLPEAYQNLPLVNRGAARVTRTAGDERFLLVALKDESPETDADRDGDYILRMDYDGNVQVSRTGNLAVHGFW